MGEQETECSADTVLCETNYKQESTLYGRVCLCSIASICVRVAHIVNLYYYSAIV